MSGRPGNLNPRRPLLALTAFNLTCASKDPIFETEPDSLGERIDEIVHSRIGVACRQWLEIEPCFQQLQDRDSFVLPVVNNAFSRQRRDDDGRNPNARAPAVAVNRWRNMVPAAAVLIIGHNYCASVRGPAGSTLFPDTGP